MLSPKYLRTLRLPDRPQVEISVDRPCPGCGYNLRGLKEDGRCPECGLHIDSRGGAPPLNLICGDDPAIRRRMQSGFLAATLGLGGMVAVRLWMIVPLPRLEKWFVIDMIALAFAIIWCLGIWLITPKALETYGQPMKGARWPARLFCLAFIPALISLALIDAGSKADELAYPLWNISRALGGLGVLVVLYMLVLPAYDAGQDHISKWLITSFWGLLFLSPFVGFVPRGIAPVGVGAVVYGFIAVFIVTWAILAGIAIACLWALYRAACWKTGHLARLGQRDERIRQTREEIDRDVLERIRPLGDWTPRENQGSGP